MPAAADPDFTRLTAVEMLNVKAEENVINNTEPITSVDLPEKEKVVCRMLRDMMYLLDTVDNVDFQVMGELQDLDYRDSGRESSDLNLANPWYNMGRSFDDENSKHNWLFANNLKVIVRLLGCFEARTWPSNLHGAGVRTMVLGAVREV